MRKKLKNYPVDKIADLFLKELLKAERKNQRSPFIDGILERNKVYFSQEIIDQVIELLLTKKIIERIPDSVSLMVFPRDKEESGLLSKHPEKMLSKINPVSHLYKLTRQGYRFVSSRQTIHTNAPNWYKQISSRWQSNKVVAIVVFIITVSFFLIRYYNAIISLFQCE